MGRKIEAEKLVAGAAVGFFGAMYVLRFVRWLGGGPGAYDGGVLGPDYPYSGTVEERLAALGGRLPHEVIIEREGLEMPEYEYAEKATAAEIEAAGGDPLTLAQGGPPVIDPRTPDYQDVLGSVYSRDIERTRRTYAASRKVLGLRPYVAPKMPVKTGGKGGRRVTR